VARGRLVHRAPAGDRPRPDMPTIRILGPGDGAVLEPVAAGAFDNAV
jgi:hypothetical protein